MITRVHEIYIKAPQEHIWDAITTPEWTAKYGYAAPIDVELRRGGKCNYLPNEGMRAMGLPDIIIDGEVLEADPPRKLVYTYRWLFSEETKAEGFSRVTWEIETTTAGFCRLSVTHEMDNAPLMAAATIAKFSEQGGGGWNWVLSDLKSLLETGKTLA
ncbi:MAG TPA: SRPBCC domain-containing protein [Steroidobacteraceae bacterium]|nr:SRPBCC domain-containing protein [Steroidobacteraceae bacterium]